MNNYNYFDPFNNYLMSQESMNNNFNFNSKDNNNLFGPYEGYLKGNMFRNLYDPYKNYKPASINITNSQEEALFNLNQIQFAMHDLNLYLDIFPNDRDMINRFSYYKNTYNTLLKQYEDQYGPLIINSVKDTTPFEWVKDNFPWEVN